MTRDRGAADPATELGRNFIQQQSERMIEAVKANDTDKVGSVVAEMRRVGGGGLGGSPWLDCGDYCQHLLDEGDAPGYAVCYWACVIRGGPGVGLGGDVRAAREARQAVTLKAGATLKARQTRLLAQGLRSIGGSMQYDCSGPICICSGDEDCNKMFSSGRCGDGICFEDDSGGVVCLCVNL